jgi:hypothetical protein
MRGMNMIINDLDFVYNGVLFWKKDEYCYILVESSAPYSRMTRKGLLVNKRISLDYYYECLEACKRNMEGGAA